MDRITELMNELADLDDAQVNELQQLIINEFESVESADPTPQTVDAMTSLADMLDAVRAEVGQREAAAQELAQRAAEAANRVRGDEDVEVGEEEDLMEAEETDDVVEEEKPVPSPDEAGMGGYEKPMDEEELPPMPVEEAPMDQAPVIVEEELPPVAPEEGVEEEEKKPAFVVYEASNESEKAAELSTETEAVTEALAEEAVTAAAEDEEAAEASEEDAAAEVADGAEASAEENSTTELSAQEPMEAPVTAAANEENLDIEVPADRRPAARTPAATVAITAGADIPGYTAGSPLDDMSAVAEAMAKRIHSLRRVNGGDGEQHIVASVTTQFPSERTLGSDPEENWGKIQNVVGPEALVAAGGHQAPFEVRYDIFGFGTTVRPVRDALPRFQADRGGIRFITPPVLVDYEDAVGVWTAETDEDPGEATKASLTVLAPEEVTVATDAITLQMQFGNLATRAYPELIARHNELGLVQHARVAELYLLGKIEDESTAVTASNVLGFARDFLVQVGRAATAYRSRHRLEPDASLRLIIPSWVRDALAADLALQMPGDATLNAYSEIDGYLSARGVVASYSVDQDSYGAQSAGALLDFKTSFTWYLFAEGTFLFLDGGTLDLGIIRDSTLVGTNDYKMFVETFEGVAKLGIESLAITSTISVNGAAAALVDTTGGGSA